MYTEKLLITTIDLFKEHYDLAISREKAELYLNSLADLFASGMELLTNLEENDFKTDSV